MGKSKIMTGIKKIGRDRQLLLIAALAAAIVSVLAAGTFAFLKENTSELVNSFTGAEKPTEVVLLSGKEFNAAIKGITEHNDSAEDSMIAEIIFGDEANASYKAAIAGAGDGIPVDVDKKGLCKAYKVLGSDGKYTVYVLTEEKVPVYANADCAYMFDFLRQLTSIKWGDEFSTSRVTNMSYMFRKCLKLETLNLSCFDTKNVQSMSHMFDMWFRYGSLEENEKAALRTITFGENFDTSNVTRMDYMFRDCRKVGTLDVSKFNTSNVMTMAYMFTNCYELAALDVGDFDTSKVTTMVQMFYGCSKLTQLDVSRFNTSNVGDMHYMFFGCSGLTELKVDSFVTSNVRDMGGMFLNCSGLTTLNVDHFYTSNVQDMSQMFSGCSGLKTLNVSSLNTSNVTAMKDMFLNCSELTTLNVSNLNTSNVTNMQRMFDGCSKLTELNVSSFDTSKVENMSYMFHSCKMLQKIYVNANLGNWADNAGIATSKEMFQGCVMLTGGNGTTYSAEKADKTYARIDTAGAPGYFTLKEGTPTVMILEELDDISANDPAVSDGATVTDNDPKEDTGTTDSSGTGEGTDTGITDPSGAGDGTNTGTTDPSDAGDGNDAGNTANSPAGDPAIVPESPKVGETPKQDSGGGDTMGAEKAAGNAGQ